MELNVEKNVPDAGPWKFDFSEKGELALYSDDFNHDVMMRVSGDFGDKRNKEIYGEYICEILNKGCARAKALEISEKDSIQKQMENAISGPNGDFIAEITAEMAKMRIALAEADKALEQLNTSKYLRNKIKDASSISPLAHALKEALEKKNN